MDGQHMQRLYLCDRRTLKRSSRVILGWGEHGTGGMEVITYARLESRRELD